MVYLRIRLRKAINPSPINIVVMKASADGPGLEQIPPNIDDDAFLDSIDSDSLSVSVEGSVEFSVSISIDLSPLSPIVSVSGCGVRL